MSEIILKKNEAGEIEEVKLSKFLADFEKEHKVPAFEHEQAPMAADQVTASLHEMAVKGKDLPEPVADYSKYYDLMREAVAESKRLEKEKKDAEKAKKDEAAAAKEKEKAEKEAAAAQIVVRQNLFLDGAVAGVQDAAGKFREELTGLKDSLPSGISVVVDDDGSFGLDISADVSDEDLSRSLGSMIGGQESNEFMRNAYQFFIGELANELVKRGVYPSMIKCGAALSSKLNAMGIRLSPRNIEGYARMATRIPKELRNAKADPSAYLEISSIPYPDKPKRAENESKGDFEARETEFHAAKVKIDEDRLTLAKMLKEGKMVGKDKEGNEVTVPMVSRKDILPVVKEVKIKRGLVEPDDPNKKSLADWARQFAEASLSLEYLKGCIKKDVVIGLPADDPHAPREYTVKDLNDLIEEAKNNLVNMLWPNLTELQKGEKTVLVPVLVDDDKNPGKKIAKKDKEGNAVKEEKSEKVYPRFIAIGS